MSFDDEQELEPGAAIDALAEEEEEVEEDEVEEEDDGMR